MFLKLPVCGELANQSIINAFTLIFFLELIDEVSNTGCLHRLNSRLTVCYTNYI